MEANLPIKYLFVLRKSVWKAVLCCLISHWAGMPLARTASRSFHLILSTFWGSFLLVDDAPMRTLWRMCVAASETTPILFKQRSPTNHRRMRTNFMEGGAMDLSHGSENTNYCYDQRFLYAIQSAQDEQAQNNVSSLSSKARGFYATCSNDDYQRIRVLSCPTTFMASRFSSIGFCIFPQHWLVGQIGMRIAFAYCRCWNVW